MHAPESARAAQNLGRVDVQNQIRELERGNEDLVRQIELLQGFKGKMVELTDMANKRNAELESDIKMITELARMFQTQQPSAPTVTSTLGSGTRSPTWTSTPTQSEVGDWPYYHERDWTTESGELHVPHSTIQGEPSLMANPETLAMLLGATSASETLAHVAGGGGPIDQLVAVAKRSYGPGVGGLRLTASVERATFWFQTHLQLQYLISREDGGSHAQMAIPPFAPLNGETCAWSRDSLPSRCAVQERLVALYLSGSHMGVAVAA
eukprot:CAMPEP_0179077186 /NCGR_PEP_ID=MMETSP0796-20121207/34485_1 /TAXON_ID=73915 /ORGANISM="Pyrodinium bahamense, Strain pbaha01" /LENGTH=265 /DNA_ID=CAMNT_0020774459 /DNA_START=51 /DNA_END=848 /DNA_ORIENTATION=+